MSHSSSPLPPFPVTHYQHIILSPHLDDAALSCGGSIHRWTTAGRPVLVITLMAADPPAGEFSHYAQYQHQSWQLPPRQAYAARRAEDAAAMDLLGADYWQLDFLDCIYRRDEGGWFYLSDEQLFGAVHPADEGTAEVWVDWFAGLGELAPGAAVYVPWGLGKHVDHQLVRRAAERWRGRGLLYYEDFPYAQVEKVRSDGLGARYVSLTEADLQAKIDAVACYASQIEILFGSLDVMREQVEGYGRRVGAVGGVGAAERYWYLIAA